MSPYPSDRRERKKDDTKVKIVDIAMEMFDVQGFDNTTMEQIAEKADVAKGTLYNYFHQKEAIISEYWLSNMKNMKPDIPNLIRSLPDTGKRLNTLFRKAAGWMKAHEAVANIYIRYRMHNAAVLEKNRGMTCQSILESIIIAGQETGDVRSDIDTAQLAEYLEKLFLLECLKWLGDPKTFSLEKRIVKMVDFFLTGAQHKV